MIDSSNQEQQFKDITQKAARGMGWNYLAFGLGKLLNLVTIAILAHILPPETFGIVALATLAIDYLSVLSNEIGIGSAIIQRQDSVEEASSTAFTLNLLTGALLTAITFAIAPLAATFFKEPSVTPILRILGLTFFITAIGSVHNARLLKELNLRTRAIPELGNSIFKGIISISLALVGFNEWSLVFGQLAGAAMATILLWIVFPWRPRLKWDINIAKDLFKYGLPVMGNNALSILEDGFDYLLIGRLYNATALGIYTLAYRLPEMMIINTLWVMTAVLFPTFASLQDQKDALKRGFLSTMRYVEILVTPISLGMIIAADPIIRIAFGEQWIEAIPIMQILSLYALIISIGFHIGDVYKAIGRPDLLIKISIPVFLIRVLAIWIGAQHSLIGVAFGHLIAGIIGLIIELIVAARILTISVKDIVRELTAFIGGMALLALGIPTLFLTVHTTPLIRLLAVGAAGALGYLCVIWIIERDSLLNVIQMLGLKQKLVNRNDARFP